MSGATVQSRANGESREGEATAGSTDIADAEVWMAPRFPAQVGGGPGVPFAEMEPP